MRKKILNAEPGMVFGIPQKDSMLLLGQVLDRPMKALISIVLFQHRVRAQSAAQVPPVHTLNVLSAVTTFPDGLERGHWPLLREGDMLALPQSQWPNEATRAGHWVGQIVHNSLIVEDLVNACAGLIPWRSYAATPDYFDSLLFPGVPRPKEADLAGGPK
jgi:hypothetical protein